MPTRSKATSIGSAENPPAGSSDGTVRLRPFRRSDLPRQQEFFRDQELAWLDSSSLEVYAGIDVERFLLGADKEPGTVRLAIEIGGEYVGYCSLMHTTNPARVFELGISIGDRRYWNRRYGRQVIHQLLKLGFDELGAREVQLTTNSRNPRAHRCFLASGFVETARIPGVIRQGDENIDAIEMSIDTECWNRNRSGASGHDKGV